MGMDKPWLRHYPKGVPPTLSYPDVPLFHYLLDAAERARTGRQSAFLERI